MKTFKGWVRFLAWSVLWGSPFCLCQPLIVQDAIENKETALEGVNAAQGEAIRREETRIAAQMIIKEAQKAVAEGDQLAKDAYDRGEYSQAMEQAQKPYYQKALSFYEDAQKRLAEAPASSIEIAQIRQGASLCLFQLAKDAYNLGEYFQAMEQAQKAYKLNPENQEAADLAESASRENDRLMAHKKEEEKAAAEVPKEISNSDFVAKQKKVLELYRAAENYFKSEQFDQAESALKVILQQ